MATKEQAKSKILEWRRNPLKFTYDQFKISPDPWQEKALVGLATNDQIAIQSCKGPGKTAFLAWAGSWYLATRSHSKIAAAAITGDNLRDNLWSEFAKWHKKSPFLKANFTWTETKIFATEYPETWWCHARTWAKNADAQAQADALAGLHGDKIMALLDESGGMAVAMLATIAAIRANADPTRHTEAKIIQCGNPTTRRGALYHAVTKERSRWLIIKISSAPDDPERTPRVTKKWAQEQIDSYGIDSPWVIVNIFGDFPPGEANALLDLDVVTRASTLVLAERDYRDEAKLMGVDVARTGNNRSVITIRQGQVMFRPKVFRNLTTTELVGQVAMVANEQKPIQIFPDANGIGAGVADRLIQLGYPVVPVMAGGAATKADRYGNKRAECWFEMSEWIKRGAAIPNDPALISELIAPTYHFDAKNRILIESKDDLEKRGVESPDIADSLSLTFAFPVPHKDITRKLARARTVEHDYDPHRDEQLQDYNPFE